MKQEDIAELTRLTAVVMINYKPEPGRPLGPVGKLVSFAIDLVESGRLNDPPVVPARGPHDWERGFEQGWGQGFERGFERGQGGVRAATRERLRSLMSKADEEVKRAAEALVRAQQAKTPKERQEAVDEATEAFKRAEKEGT